MTAIRLASEDDLFEFELQMEHLRRAVRVLYALSRTAPADQLDLDARFNAHDALLSQIDRLETHAAVARIAAPQNDR